MQMLFALPNDVLISSICKRYPCRDQEIRSLATLLSVNGLPQQVLVNRVLIPILLRVEARPAEISSSTASKPLVKVPSRKPFLKCYHLPRTGRLATGNQRIYDMP
jgi:hypothetical protein